MIHNQLCGNCNREFSFPNQQTFCSPQCKKKKLEDNAKRDLERQKELSDYGRNPLRKCFECSRQYKRTASPDKKFCSEKCYKFNRNKTEGRVCQKCKVLVFNGTTLHDHCRPEVIKIEKEKIDKEAQRIAKANQDFLDGKSNYARGKKQSEINKKNGHTLQKAMEKMEWTRCMRDGGWSHFNKGRKWDRI